MKKKVKTILFVFIIIGVMILNITYKNKNEVTKTKRKKQNNLAIMIKEDGATDYTKASSKDIPKGNYVLNRDKSYCKNNGVIGDYDSTLGKISFSFIGTDSCYLYFDVITDTEKPVISNLVVNDTTITAILTDNESLSGYGISTSNSTEPKSWTTISGKTYNLSTTITTEGTYYLWVKDGAGNINNKIILITQSFAQFLINKYTTNNKLATRETFSESFTTANDNLYYTNKTEDGSIVYYYAGNTSNNWVKFGKWPVTYWYCETPSGETYNDHYSTECPSDYTNRSVASIGDDIMWRIIRTNEDGSVRLLYSVGTGNLTFLHYVTNEHFSSNSDREATSVGYMSSYYNQHDNDYNSNIKYALDSWYELIFKNKSDNNGVLYDNQISKTAIYCNDRSVGSGTWEYGGRNFYFGAYTRLYTNSLPSYKCGANASGGLFENIQSIDDKFSVSSEKGGNGKLTYGIALMTADEVYFAGGYKTKSTSVWYNTGNQGAIVTMTPSYVDSGGDASVYVANPSVNSEYPSTTPRIRPVISLDKCVSYSSGDGTFENPYIVDSKNC